MSRQYQKNKHKKNEKRTKADPRFTAEQPMVVDDAYMPQEGDSVMSTSHPGYGVGKVTSVVDKISSAVVYWPSPNQTTVQGFHVLVKKETDVVAVDTDAANQQIVMSDSTTVDSREHEKAVRGRRGRSKAENTSMREDQYAFLSGSRVLHAHHKAFGSGRIVGRKKHGLNEYRWDVRWNDGRTRAHGADYLVRLSGGPGRPTTKEVKQTKPSNPNRAWREHKLKNRYGGVRDAVFCSECEVVLPGGGYGSPDDPRRWCHDCFQAKKRGSVRHANCDSLREIPPETNVRTKRATAKQMRVIAELSCQKAVNTTADISSLSVERASVIINSWQGLPDAAVTLATGLYTISPVQKKVIVDLKKRVRADPISISDPIMSTYSAASASQLIKELQQALDGHSDVY